MNKFLLLFFAWFCALQHGAAQCEPLLLNCNTPVQSCDLSINDPQYWNDLSWWDNQIQTHDLSEAPIDLNIMVLDTCPGDVLSVRCLLFMDLDGNGTAETVVDSDNPPDFGMVNYNNANNPNYSGGTPRAFDQRPVPSNAMWRFVLSSSNFGGVTTYSLKWVSALNPANLVLPELPHNVHAVRWTVTNSAGLVKTCDKNFVVKDCQAPTVVCLNGLSVNIMPTGMISLWASDFLQYTEDNVTPTHLIKTGIRKAGTGTGFPVDNNGNPITNLVFDCDELGAQDVELWAIDLDGNASMCITYVIVQDNLLVCTNPPALIEACATDACGEVSEDNTFSFTTNEPIPTSIFDFGACGSLNQVIKPNTDVIISVANDDNPLNGVSSFDMVLILHHIEGTNVFDSPYQYIAADANNDKVIDTFDILECRKLILGIYNQLPNNSSWRFVDKSYVFPSPDPLSAPFPETITVNSNNLPTTPVEFVGVKMCDLSCGNLVDFFELEPENQHLVGVPQPNPSTAGANLPIQLLQPEIVELELYDLSGKLLFQNELELPAGPAILEIPAFAMVNAGMYTWHVRVGMLSKTGKLVRN